MLSPREFIMVFTFKLVYSNIVYTIEISSHATLQELFDKAHDKFTPHVNYDIYYLNYVFAGQDKSELAPAIEINNLDEPLWHDFMDKWKHISFYIRPMNKISNSFHRRDNYNFADMLAP